MGAERYSIGVPAFSACWDDQRWEDTGGCLCLPSQGHPAYNISAINSKTSLNNHKSQTELYCCFAAQKGLSPQQLRPRSAHPARLAVYPCFCLLGRAEAFCRLQIWVSCFEALLVAFCKRSSHSAGYFTPASNARPQVSVEASENRDDTGATQKLLRKR